MGSSMEEMNLSMLKRKDADAEQILGTSLHVTMYLMSVETQKWERANVEGTLYVVKRKTNPRFQLVVLNKLSTDNYVETIESGFHAEVSPPYLIYTQGGGKVHGVWFYEQSDLDKIAALLTKIESGLPKPAIPPPEAQAQESITRGSAAASASDDGGFWDKKPAQKDAPPPPPVTEVPPNGNSIASLFNKMQIKQQQQQQTTASTATSLAPLPPAFFQQQQAQQDVQAPNKALDHLRQAAALPAAPSAEARGLGAEADNAITKLFKKQPPPTQAAPPPGQNAIQALFDNAANRSAALPWAHPPPQPVTTPPPPPARPVVDERLRVALARLVSRDEFLALLAEELQRAGLPFK